MTPAEAFTEHQPLLLRLAGKWFGSQNAEEAVAMMWVKAVKYWAMYRGDCAVQTWLAAILRNEWIMEMRKRRSREKINLPMMDGIDVAVQPGFDVAICDDGDIRLRTVLLRMKPKHRAHLLEWAARDDNGATLRGQQQVATNTEKIRWHRAIRKARSIAAMAA
jgi:DNA-directed RNA polymerase specialized sigma24 family protein